MATVIIQEHFLTAEESSVIRRLYEEIIEPPETDAGGRGGRVHENTIVHVYEHPRLGKSGAKVGTCIFGSGRPFIVKIGDARKIASESAALRRVFKFFVDAGAAGSMCSEENSLSGIAYQHFTAQTLEHVRDQFRHQRVSELEDKILSRSFTDEELRGVLSRIISEKLKSCHDVASSNPLNLREAYADWGYLRGHRSASILKATLCTTSSAEFVTIDGERFCNPLFAVENFFGRSAQCRLGPTHGDLHPRNIVFDPADNPHLIDFRWANPQGHVMLDLVALEVSIRFFLFPKYYPREFAYQMNRTLAQADWVGQLPVPTISTPQLNGMVAKVSTAIDVLRGYVRREFGDDALPEYLASLFLYLYGVLGIDTCDKHLGIHALSCTASQLRESAFGLA